MLYVSFGSHAPEAHVSDTLLADYTNVLATSPYPVLLALTSAIEEAVAPDVYKYQLKTRNNVRISAKNGLASTACNVVRSCRVVDIFALSWSGLEVRGVYHKNDPVHFGGQVMSAVVALVLPKLEKLWQGTGDKLPLFLPAM